MDATTDSSTPLYRTGPSRCRVLWRLLSAPNLAVCAALAILTGWALLNPQSVSGQIRDSYEGPDVSWKLADHDCAPRISQHERSFEQAHSGQASELIRFYAGNGTYVHLVSPIPASRIIDELTMSVWVKANRPGLQLAARAVLPRSTDSRTGRHLTTLIRGTTYT